MESGKLKIKRCRVCGPEVAPGVTFFRMPRSLTMFQKWQEIVLNSAKVKLCTKDYLCENHFLKEEIVCRGSPGQDLRLELNCNAYPTNFARFETGHNFDSENTEKVKVVMIEQDAILEDIMNTRLMYPNRIGLIELKEQDRQEFIEFEKVPYREGEFVKLEDGCQINEFGMTRRVKATENWAPDSREEPAPIEEERLTFEILKNSMAKLLPHDGWSYSQVDEDRVIFQQIRFSDKLVPWCERKVIVERDLVMHAFLLEKLLFFLPNLSSLSAVKSSLIEVDNARICAGGVLNEPRDYRIFNNAYRDCSGKWRHTKCVLQVVDDNVYCDHCEQMNLLFMAAKVSDDFAQKVEHEFNKL